MVTRLRLHAPALPAHAGAWGATHAGIRWRDPRQASRRPRRDKRWQRIRGQVRHAPYGTLSGRRLDRRLAEPVASTVIHFAGRHRRGDRGICGHDGAAARRRRVHHRWSRRLVHRLHRRRPGHRHRGVAAPAAPICSRSWPPRLTQLWSARATVEGRELQDSSASVTSCMPMSSPTTAPPDPLIDDLMARTRAVLPAQAGMQIAPEQARSSPS